MTAWYYVDENRERIGPVDEGEITKLIDSNVLVSDSYIWRKGFENWMMLKDVEEFGSGGAAVETTPQAGPAVIEEVTAKEFSWDTVSNNERIFHIKIGIDRGGRETEYGPYCLDELKKAFVEKRI